MNLREKGLLGEDIAQRYLLGEGYEILEHGFRSRQGEVDLIAKRQDELFFIEVKTRWSKDYGNPLESVNRTKQKQVIKAARYYLAKQKRRDPICHLSAMGIDMSSGEPEIEFIKDAFEVG